MIIALGLAKLAMPYFVTLSGKVHLSLVMLWEPQVLIGGGVSSDRDIELDGTEPVSMNVWGFTPDLFGHLRSMFEDFLENEGEEMKSEFLIPSVINALIQTETKNVKVLRTGSSWFGVTYKEDKPYVIEQVQDLIDEGAYPDRLF